MTTKIESSEHTVFVKINYDDKGIIIGTDLMGEFSVGDGLIAAIRILEWCQKKCAESEVKDNLADLLADALNLPNALLQLGAYKNKLKK